MFGRKIKIKNGFYLEMDEFTVKYENGHLNARQEPETMRVSELLQILKMADICLPAYVNRNILASNPLEILDVHMIFQGKQEIFENRMKKPVRPNVSFPGAFEREQAKRDIAAINASLQTELEAIDRRLDFVERVKNGGWFTDEEEAFMGQISGNEYMDSVMFREYLKNEKRQKARSKIEQLRYGVENQERKAREALEHYEKLLEEYEKRERRRNRITLMCCGMVVRQEGKLVALLLLRDKNPVWQIYVPDALQLPKLSGEVYEVETLGEKQPEAEPLLRYMEEAYREELPAQFHFDKVRQKL